MTLTILLTGASGGFGPFLSEQFSSMGHRVIEHHGHRDIDLSNLANISKLSERAIDNGVNVLINNAAIICPAIPFPDYSEAQISNMINVNLVAPILLIHQLYDRLEGVININSMVGLETKKLRTMYSASKWGLRGFSNSLKSESSNKHILDVYPTNMRTWPNRPDSQDAHECAAKIYHAFIRGDDNLILDGRPN